MQRPEMLQLRVSKHFKQLTHDRADLYGLSVSEYIRHLILNDAEKDTLME